MFRRNYTQFGMLILTLGLAVPAALAQKAKGLGGVTGAVTGTVGTTVDGTVDTVARPGGPPAAGEHPRHGGVLAQPLDASLGLAQNAELASRLEWMMPPGRNPAEAAMGFANQAEFVAALHAAHNLQIPFDDLKAEMMGNQKLSLERAIRNLRPAIDEKTVKDNIKVARKQAARDIEQSSKGNKQDKFAARIVSNTALASRLEAMLPEGMTLESAAAGFKNDGQFISSLVVSKNLGIPFAEVKNRVTAGQSLGAAIQALKPGISAEAAASNSTEAEAEANTIRVGASVRTETNARAATTP